MDKIIRTNEGPSSTSRPAKGQTAAGMGQGSYPLTGAPNPVFVEKRSSDKERRSFTLKTLIHCLASPRRSRGRRKQDRQFPLLDIFDSGAMFMAVSLMLLSLADAFFTLNIIARGGTEVNPVMNYFLSHGIFAFVSVKVVLTAIPAVVLVASGNYKLFRLVRVRSIMAAAIGCYAGLIVYEIGLLTLV